MDLCCPKADISGGHDGSSDKSGSDNGASAVFCNIRTSVPTMYFNRLGS